MKKNLTEIVCVIDNSGSMGIIKNDAIGGFNSFIESQKEVEGEARVSIYLFNTVVTQIANNVDIKEVVLLNDKNYITTGWTALNDALGETLNKVGQRLLITKEADRPEKVIFCILTDGKENSSIEYTTTHVKDQIMHRQKNFGWDFVFLAANQDAIKTGEQYAFSPKSSFNFEATSMGIREAYRGMSDYVTTSRA